MHVECTHPADEVFMISIVGGNLKRMNPVPPRPHRVVYLSVSDLRHWITNGELPKNKEAEVEVWAGRLEGSPINYKDALSQLRDSVRTWPQLQ
jgi:hypothetical protein